MKIFAKFHQQKTIFDEIRGHLRILLFYRSLTRAYKGRLRKKASKILRGCSAYAKFSQNMSNIIILKLKKCRAPQIFVLGTSR